MTKKEVYKVFVDHKPIVFLRKELCDDSAIKYKRLPKLLNELKKLMIDTSNEKPLKVRCKDPEQAFEEYFEPYRQVTAAGGIVRRKDKFMVIKRNGLWDIPKGKVEKGESIDVAAIREVEEECGIENPTIHKFLTTTFHLFNYKGKKAIKETYWYIMNYEGPKETFPQKKEGITKAKWMTLEEMLGIRGNTYGSINELLDVFEVSIES